jgi:hypothetical protein
MARWRGMTLSFDQQGRGREPRSLRGAVHFVATLCIAALYCAGALTFAGAHDRPLGLRDLIGLLRGGVFTQRVAKLVLERGIAFVPTKGNITALRRAGADHVLLDAIKEAKYASAEASVPEAKAPPAEHGPSSSPISTRVSVNQARIVSRQTSRLASAKPPAAQAASATSGIAPGTKITMATWRLFRGYMPAGMIRLFEGDLFWKMPLDVEMEVGPSTIENLPPWYIDATRKYSKQVEVVHLPDGHNDIRNYVGGIPFPNPQEPDKGYKLLADLWFAYTPAIVAGTLANPLRTCAQDAMGSIKCLKLVYMYRQLAYNTDPGVPREELNSKDLWYSEWAAVEEPEQTKYTAQLTLFYRDNQRQEELYTYVPQLRTSIRGSLASRCSPVSGIDYVQDDYKGTGFNGGIARFDAQFIQHQEILGIIGGYKPMAGSFPRNYYMPLDGRLPRGPNGNCGTST